jgi:PTS system mannose-specific IIC component
VTLPPLVVAFLLAWGVVVALDLVSGPQALLARPLVAGTVAGLLAGDAEAGLRLGVILEMFALDVLPVGASRYPDYGPATVAAVAAVAGLPWQERTGLAVLVALLLAMLGGWTMQWLRHANARAVDRRLADLATGDPRVVARLQLAGIGRDAARGALLTGLGLALALATRHVALPGSIAQLLLAGAVGSAITAVAAGTVRGAGKGARFRWALAGMGVGVALVAGFLA